MLREIPALAWYLGRPVTTVREAYLCQRLYLQPPRRWAKPPRRLPSGGAPAAVLAFRRSCGRKRPNSPSGYGIAQVAVALKLDYKSLKHRLTARNAAENARSAAASSSFVELDLGLPLTPPVCVLVLTDRAGRALRIELPQAASSHLAEVACSLWQVQACSR